MALLFIDSFDHYTDSDQTLDKYTDAFIAPDVAIGEGRCGTSAMNMDTFKRITRGVLFGSTRCTIGFAAKIRSDLTGIGNITYGWFGDAQGNIHIGLSRLVDGSLSVYRNASVDEVLGTTALGLVFMDQYYFLELQVLFHETAGEVILRHNDVEVLNLTGICTVGEDFSGFFDTPPRTVSLRCSSNQAWYLDDLYILDSTGAAPCNDFLGDSKVEYLRPNAAGTYQQWTPVGAATHWQAVDDDATPDLDTTYVESTTPGDIDTNNYEPTGLPSGTIFGAQLSLHAKKSDIGPRIIAPVCNAAVGSPIIGVSSESYQYFSQMYQTNPATGLPWTITEINAAQFGVKVVS